MVAIDTLAATLHGEENQSLVLQQYVTMLNMVQGVTPGCATLVTHHVRKQAQGANATPIRTIEEMRAAIRGSNALLGGVRMAIGIWHDGAAKGRTLFRMGVVKGNNDEVMPGEQLLGRAKHGGLEAVDPASLGSDYEARQWLAAAVEQAVATYFPFSHTDPDTGLFARKGDLPPFFKKWGRNELQELAKSMLDDKRLVKQPCARGFRLDVPDGMLANQEALRYELAKRVPNLDWVGWGYDAKTGQVFPPKA
jgi:hypothetical protein